MWLKIRLLEMLLSWVKFGRGFWATLSGQPPQPTEMAVYGRWSTWLWVTLVRAAYPTSMPTPPRNSAGRLNTRLSVTVLLNVCDEPVAVGMFTLPNWIPLPEMSVNTLPLTRSFCDPLFRPKPAPPRWTNESLVNWMCWSKPNDTLAGVWVQAAYGQVPCTLAGATSHSAWRAAPSGPVTW